MRLQEEGTVQEKEENVWEKTMFPGTFQWFCVWFQTLSCKSPGLQQSSLFKLQFIE